MPRAVRGATLPPVNDTIAAEPTAASGPKHPGRRRWATRGLVALAALLLVIGALGTWVERVVLDTPTWTDTSQKAIQDPVVQQALGTYLVDQLYDNVDMTAQVQSVLPDAAKPLAAPVAAGLRDFADRAAVRALQSPRVQDLWATANETASRALIHTIEGGGPAVSTTNGEVTLNLQPLTDQLANRTGVGSRLANAIPPGTGQLVLLRSNQLKTAQDAANVLRVIGEVSLILVIVVLALAVWLAPDRRWAVRTAAFGVLAAGLILIVVRRVVGGQIIDSVVTADSVRPAAHRVWWIATEELRMIIISIVAFGIIGLLGAILAGPGRRMTATRGWLAAYLREPAIAYGALGIVLLLLLAWSPTPATRNWLTIIIGIALAVLGLEALRRQTAREFPDAERGELSLGSLWHRGGAGTPAPAGEEQRLTQLSQLGTLHAEGVLDDDEFAREKRRLLTEGPPPAAAT
jgi:hypothetical protein